MVGILISHINDGVTMDLSSVGATLSAETQRQTLEKVNVSLLKQSQDQQEKITTQLLQSVTPAQASSPESALGQHVDIRV